MGSPRSRDEVRRWPAPTLFFVLGIFALAAAQADFPPPIPDIFLAVGSSVIGVVIVTVLWWLFGGEPVSEALGRLERATDTLDDVVSLQIEALHGSRQHPDRLTTAEKWVRLVTEAKEIDIVGSSLKRDWYDDEDFQNALDIAVVKGASVRLSMLCPRNRSGHDDCGALEFRLAQQAPGEDSLLAEYLTKTFPKLERDVAKYASRELKGTFQAHTVCSGVVYAFILRIDSYFFVAPYLTSGKGRDSIAFEFFGERSAWGKVYRKELDAVFARARPVGGGDPGHDNGGVEQSAKKTGMAWPTQVPPKISQS